MHSMIWLAMMLLGSVLGQPTHLKVSCERTLLAGFYYIRFQHASELPPNVELRLNLINNRFGYRRSLPMVVPFKQQSSAEKSMAVTYEDLVAKAPWMDDMEATLWTADGSRLLSTIARFSADSICGLTATDDDDE